VKASLELLGYTCRATKSLPIGFDLFHDLRRLKMKPIEVVFDIGANVGHTAAAFTRAYPRARVYCFEPGPATFHTLLQNAGGKVKAFQLAVGSAVGTAVLYAEKDSYLNSLVPELNTARSGASPASISVTTVDRFCEEHGIDRIDLLKTDTEGYELEVLKGAAKLLKERRVGAIYVECALTKSPRHVDVRVLIEYLGEYGYHLHALYEQSVFENRFFCNALFIANNP
jgi:FkbM family methyltransferase